MLPARAFLCSPRALSVGIAATILGGIAAAGCFSGEQGLPPPRDRFYFPTGLVISPGGQTLYVANSDFDLRYTGGTVQAIDLPAVREKAWLLQAELQSAASEPAGGGMGGGGGGGGDGMTGGDAARPTTEQACGAVGLALNPNPLLNPGPCTALDAAPLIRASAIIGAFASGALLVHRPAAEGPGARLFIPVRGDPSVTYFEVPDDRGCATAGAGCAPEFRLGCGASEDGRCSSDFRIGENPYESSRALQLPLEPVGMVASPSGEAIVTAHQTQGAASLIVNRWGDKPLLEHVIQELSAQPTELAALPLPGLAAACRDQISYQPGFLLTYRAAPVLDLLRYDADALANAPRPFLSRAASLGIDVNTSGFDSRGVAVDASERTACEQACCEQRCAAGDAGCLAGCAEQPPRAEDAEDLGEPACLASCADIPMRFFVSNRAPASLLIGEARTVLVDRTEGDAPGEGACGALGVSSAYETVEIQDTVALSYGASRVAIGHVLDESGAPQRRVFAVAFDSRFIYSYDPEARRVDAIIRTGRGPHAIAFDTGYDPDRGWYSFMYVGHFTDSYIGVVDLDTRRASTFGSMFLALGQPEPPQESR